MLPPLIALLALAAFEVQGPSTCPRPEAVKARLSEVPIEEEHLVELKNVRGVLHIRLLDGRGALLGERDLARNSSCEELAEAAAVLVSAWTIEVPALELPSLEPETELAIEAPGQAPGDAPKLNEAAPLPAPPIAFSSPKIVATPITDTLIHDERGLHDRGGSHDFDFGFSTGIGERLTRADGIVASYVYWPLDGLGIETSFHWHFLDDGLTNLAFAAHQNLVDLPPVLTDLHSPTWALGFNALGSLARGPVRLIGLVGGPSLELFGTFGFGPGVIHRDSISSAFGSSFLVAEDELTIVAQAGAGLRIYGFREAIALEIEMRDLFYPDPNGAGTTHSLQLQGGLRVAIDPNAWRAREQQDRTTRSLANRLVLTPMIAMGFFDDFVSTVGFVGNVTYNVFDYVAVETIGGYFFPSSTALTDELIQEGMVTPGAAHRSELLWTFGVGARVNALRGRIAPLGLPFGADLTLYFAGGIGFGQSRSPCTVGGSSGCPEVGLGAPLPEEQIFTFEPARLVAVGNFGGGLQLELGDWIGLTIEMRDFIFRASAPFDPVALEPNTQLTRHTVLAQLGTSFLFF